MKKLALILAALALIGAMVMTACTSDDPAADTTAADTTNATAPDESTTPEATTTASTQPSGKVNYTIIVKDQDGNPVQGVSVQLCEDTTCRLPRDTDANGSVVYTENSATYHAKIASLPDGYTAEMNDSGDDFKYHDFPDGSYELTITITKN